ncbi:MAG TPA: GYF domain-containing protein, partial [Candidatus Udaeobacter sp.]|nr:GYF domain-containing protein [Candidatus Udaeobacter sp.]
MIRDDQDVTDEWIVRVDGREYGPANIDTLREWKAEGRVLPVNEARPAGAELWTLAAEIPGLFEVETPATDSAAPLTRSPGQGEVPPALPSR